MAEEGRVLALDVVIFGGGIAGLWLLARLRQQGYSALLLEANALGAGQTRHAQGIVHGGIKYTLSGNVTASAYAVAAMPARWGDCLQGKGELDLQAVRILSGQQYLWSTASLTSRMAGFFASKLMRSRTRPVEGDARPAVFQHPQFKGQLYRLDEPILDTATLVKALAEPQRKLIWGCDWPDGIRFDVSQAGTPAIEVYSDQQQIRLEPKALVLAAGKGNAGLLAALGRSTPPMQLRPLQMVMVRGELPALYAHCLGASANPRITITTHYDNNGRPVWYLGGQLAEDGVARSPEEQIASAQQEIQSLLPWLDVSTLQWATLHIDRAEPQQPGSKRPDSVFASDDGGVITAWPTKLALAPLLSDEVLALLSRDGVTPGAMEGELPTWRFPGYAPLPWQEEARWS